MVKLKERESLPENFPQGLTPGDLISTPPILDINQARRVRLLVENAGLGSYPALELALSLAAYNFHIFYQATDDRINQFLHRFTRLSDREKAAADPQNPLPTIGFEVETPRKPSPEERYINYGRFFDTLGMPRNKVNSGDGFFHFWEFSPPPSYTASVQARIISELIKGRFIPSLRYSKDPVDIRKYLDDKLISLHINLGLPTGLGEDWFPQKDIGVFSTMFPLAFTSPLRLEHRSQLSFCNRKSADQTAKSGGLLRRLEMKAFEVSDERTFRLMKEIQLLAASMFHSSFLDREDPLSRVWMDIKRDVLNIYQQYGVEALLDKKPAISQLVRETDISSKLRQVITRGASRIRIVAFAI